MRKPPRHGPRPPRALRVGLHPLGPLGPVTSLGRARAISALPWPKPGRVASSKAVPSIRARSSITTRPKA